MAKLEAQKGEEITKAVPCLLEFLYFYGYEIVIMISKEITYYTMALEAEKQTKKH